MHRVTRTLILGIGMAVAVAASGGVVQAKCPKDGSPSRDVCKFWSAMLMPGVAGFGYLPGDDAMGPWLGGGLRIAAYTWSDNSAAFGPSQGKIFLDLGLLGSGEDDTGRMSLFRSGINLSFEGNASRDWLIPYYGVAMGRVAERNLAVHWFAEAVLGVHALYRPSFHIDIEGGYALPFSDVDTMAAPTVQVAMSMTLW